MTLVRLHWTLLDDIDPARLRACESLLDLQERAYVARFKRPEDRLQRTVGWALARRALSLQLDLSPSTWSFSRDERGKPRASGPTDKPYFNISHTTGMAVCAVCDDAEVGVDCEWLGRGTDLESVSRRYFSKAELERLAAAPADERPGVFYEIWTAREAFMKGTGLGMHLSLKSFQTLPDARIEDSSGVRQDWALAVRRPTPSHICTVAANSATIDLHVIDETATI